MAACKCGSGKSFKECCEPFIKGTTLPNSPEELLRSRYVAYATQKVEYIQATTHPDKLETFSLEGAKEWSKNTVWNKLEIDGCPKSDQVEFTAWYTEEGEEIRHHEVSTFKKKGDRWYFYDSKFPKLP